MVTQIFTHRHEHPAATAGRVEHARVLVWLENLYQKFNDRSWCEKFSAAFALRRSKLTKKVLVDTTEDIFLPVKIMIKGNARKNIYKFTNDSMIECCAGIYFRQDAFELGSA